MLMSGSVLFLPVEQMNSRQSFCTTHQAKINIVHFNSFKEHMEIGSVNCDYLFSIKLKLEQMRLNICENLRTASFNPKFTRSYKKINVCLNYIH